jgi:hypothetical protein
MVRDNAGAFQNELRPEPEKGDRDLLQADGLIRSEKRGRRIWIEVTDRGWAWAGENLGAELPKASSAGSQILKAWLARLKAFMDARAIVLADILAPRIPMGKSEPVGSAHFEGAGVRDRIRQAYLDVTGGRFNARVPLSEIRERVKDIARPALDDTLRQMHLEEGTTLSGLDNPQEITPAIRDAGLIFKGEPKFVLWITK